MIKYNSETLINFLIESNKIERIRNDISPAQFQAAESFLQADEVDLEALCAFVEDFQSGAALRDQKGMNVKVGQDFLPLGGIQVVGRLKRLLEKVNTNTHSPFAVHIRYEYLHPFMDCNGRSGRILWAWQMLHFDYQPGIDLGFLHAFYYQTLQNQ